jgi:hypothetical protein
MVCNAENEVCRIKIEIKSEIGIRMGIGNKTKIAKKDHDQDRD